MVIVNILYIENMNSESDAMKILISNTAGVPIYEQIKEQIKEAVLREELKPGELLPSIRQLAKDLRISVITTTRAYSDLEQEGFVINVQGKGCYVQEQNSELLREQKLRQIEEHLLAAIKAARLAQMKENELLNVFQILLKEEV